MLVTYLCDNKTNIDKTTQIFWVTCNGLGVAGRIGGGAAVGTADRWALQTLIRRVSEEAKPRYRGHARTQHEMYYTYVDEIEEAGGRRAGQLVHPELCVLVSGGGPRSTPEQWLTE